MTIASEGGRDCTFALGGRTAFVTGGASGIGRAVALMLGRSGATTVVADIDAPGAEEVAHAIIDNGGRARALRLDVSNEEEWEFALASVERDDGALHYLCNIAGIGAAADLEEFTLDHWNRELAINLTGVFLGCKHGVRSIKKYGKRGSIVNLGSVSALVGLPFQAAYNASKGGVRVLTKAVALHCTSKGYGIRCNAVHPTYVNTNMLTPFESLFGGRASMAQAMSRDVPLGRIADPSDIAQTVLFLLSDASSMITGTEIIVDGGHTAGVPTHFQE